MNSKQSAHRRLPLKMQTKAAKHPLLSAAAIAVFGSAIWKSAAKRKGN